MIYFSPRTYNIFFVDLHACLFVFAFENMLSFPFHAGGILRDGRKNHYTWLSILQNILQPMSPFRNAYWI